MYIETDERGCEWSSEDGMATELEVREFMYGLVRLIKPQIVIETGSYTGEMTTYIADGMRSNNVSRRLDTCETDRELFARAQRLTEMFDFVTVHHMTGVELINRSDRIDLAFLDSGGDRLEEVKALLPRLNQGAFVVIHDTNRVAERRSVKHIQAAGIPGTQQLDLPTPRGLSILRMGLTREEPALV